MYVCTVVYVYIGMYKYTGVFKCIYVSIFKNNTCIEHMPNYLQQMFWRMVVEENSHFSLYTHLYCFTFCDTFHLCFTFI